MIPSFYGPPCCVKAMKGRAFSLTLMLLLVPLAGCAGSEDSDLERFELSSGTAEFDQDSVLFPFQFLFGDYQLTLETAARDIMENHVSGNMTYEGAIEILESMGRNSTFYEQSAQWDNYDEYSWEIVLVSGSGTWDVLWLDYEKSVAINTVGPDSDLWRNWSSTLNERGMDSSGSKGPLAKPEQTCSGDPDNEVRWLTPYGFKNNCTADLDGNDIYTFNIYSLSGEDFVLEWKVFGWK